VGGGIAWWAPRLLTGRRRQGLRSAPTVRQPTSDDRRFSGYPLTDVDHAPANAATARFGEIRSLTGLRSVAATWVVVFHLGWFLAIAAPGATSGLWPLIGSGAQGVDLFFLLSGYVLALNYTDRIGARPRWGDTLRFLGARIARVWPVYVVTLHLAGILLLLQVKFGDHPTVLDVSPLGYVRQLFMVELWSQRYFDNVAWDGPAWSISAEWLAYLLFPALALVLFRLRRRLRSRSLLVLAFVISLGPSVLLVSTGHFYTPYSWVVRILAEFTAGAVAYSAIARMRPSDRTRRVAGYLSVLLVIAIVALLFQLTDHPIDGIPDSVGLVDVLFLPLVGTLAIGTTGIARLLASGPFVFGGKISYSMYLVHGLVISALMAMWHHLANHPTGTPLLLLVPALLGVMFLLAWLLYVAVEEPGRRWLRGRLEFRARASPQVVAGNLVDHGR
jgi:peptidoglycan/LPS O-acetylase OafA/YrhL